MSESPAMSLSPEEKRYYGQLFKTADKERVGVITGDVAVKFFERSNLPAATLGLIWEISDKENSGFLTQQSFSVALRLIGQAQQGVEPEAALAKKPGPLPIFDGIDAPSSQQPPASRTAAAPQPPKSRGMIPPLTPEDRAKYLNSWISVNPSSDMLDGERARDVFQKSRLPVEQLGQIWALTDTRQRGALDQTEFIVAMHLVQSMMSGSVKAVPAQLPAGLFDAAASGPPAASIRQQRQQSSISSVRSQEPVQQQFSGQRQTVPMRSQLTGPPSRGQQQASGPAQGISRSATEPAAGGADWDVKPHEKANYDNLFNDLDKSQKGYILGEEAVDFFGQSKLPHDDLAKIWDLADPDVSGQLNKDWFAVAMHLIKGKLGGQEIPNMLPASMIPPSARTKMQPPTAAVVAEAQAQPVQPSSAAADLFGLNDSFSAPAPSQSPPAQAFTDNYGAIDRVTSPDANAGRSLVNHRAAPPPPRGFGGQAAFVPSSSFGQSIQQGQAQSPVVAQPSQGRVQPEQDLLSDAEPSQTRNLNNDSTEMANLNNQMSSLTNQQQQTRQEKSQIEADMAKMNSQKVELTARLAQIREAYDQEVKTVRTMQVEQGRLRTETRELVKEASLLEASLDAVRQQHETIGAQLEKDKSDNANIKERIKSANEQTVTLKATLDKVQKEAKQQRSLVAINTKQLNTLEAGHESLNDQIDKEQADAAEHQRIAAIEQERARANLEQSRSAMISPALSTASASTNPFHRVSSPAATEGSRSMMSPFNQIFSQSQSNNVAHAAPPSTTFQSVKPAVTGGALAGMSAAAGAIAFGEHEHDQSNHEEASSAQEQGHTRADESVTSSYDAVPVSANSVTSPPPASLSGFDHAFNPDPSSSASLSGFDHAFSQASPQSNGALQSGFSQPPAFSEETVQQDAPKDSAPAEFQRHEHNAPEFDNESVSAQVADRSIVSPKPVAPQAQNWSDTDPFTADARVASPELQALNTRPMPAAVTSLALPSNRSDDGSVGTSVRAEAPASIRETPSNSRPTTPTSTFSRPTTQGSTTREIESATQEHELSDVVSPAAVQQTLSSPPQNDALPARALSPPAAIPGAFPLDQNLGGRNNDESSAFAAQDPSAGHINQVDPYSVSQQSAQEIESSDDETIEQPRGADFFSNIHSRTQTRDADSASVDTITKEDTRAQPVASHTSSIVPAAGVSADKDDEFDEFDDLEEAQEADEDEELENSFTTNNNDFDTSFNAPSARTSFIPGSSTLSTPTQLKPQLKDEQNPSPARDFSEFSHYGAVLGEPSGLAPAIIEPDDASSTRGVASSAAIPSNLLQYSASRGQQAARPQTSTSQSTTTTTSTPAPVPPASRYGASLAPKRPEPARAISAADDPMLTELTEMGFTRDKSVSALEKFNYDLGAATDWLLKGN